MTHPRFVFVIPYRDRQHHKQFFDVYIKYLLEDMNESEYEIIFVHQTDKRPFNCGAMKNIGFLYIKEKYKETYKDITFIFNDVDTLPYQKNLLKYDTVYGEVKHFYGYEFALGGIVSIKGGDFEKINGYPNYWGYGFEDNILYKRAKEVYKINRDQFYTINSNEILQFYDGIKKIMDKNNLNNQFNKSYIEQDGLSKLSNVQYLFKNNMLQVITFEGLYNSDNFQSYAHSLFNGSKIVKKDNRFVKMEMYR
jgi:hypothetical protein